jgi:hypothetical protein
MKIKFLIYVCVLFALGGQAKSQLLKVSADTNNVMVGDWITINYQYLADKKSDVVLPVLLKDSLDKLQIIRESKADTVKNGKSFGLSKKYIVSAYDSGSFVVPRLYALVNDQGQIDTVYSDSLVLNFALPKVDTSKAIRDIKDIYAVDYSDNTWIYVVVILLILIIVAILAYKYYKKRKLNKVEESIDYDPNIPPYILAMESLRRVEQERLWQNGYFKKYYSEIVDILRIYYHRIYDIKTKELTSSELVDALAGQRLFDEESRAMLQYISQYSDLSKFAKANPLPENNTQSLKYAFELVERGKTLSDEKDGGENAK